MMIMNINQRGVLNKSPNKIPFMMAKPSLALLNLWSYACGRISFIFCTLVKVNAKYLSEPFVEFQRRVLSLAPVSTVSPADFFQKAEVVDSIDQIKILLFELISFFLYRLFF